MKHRPTMSLLVCLLTACHTTSATVVPKVVGSPTATSPVGATALGPTRTITGDTIALSLTGNVKLRANSPSGVAVDKGNGIISDNSEGVISDAGSGLISNNGVNYHLTATSPAAKEALLANAPVQILDAAGRTLVDAQGKPLGGKTDAHGSYQLALHLPKENLVLHVPLSTGGALQAFLVPSASGKQTLDLDTGSSLGASYVLARFVQGKATVLAKLPAVEAGNLTNVLNTGLATSPEVLAAAPRYTDTELEKAGDSLRAKAPSVDQEIKTVQELLLGQAQLGSGLLATQVPLVALTALAFDTQGRLLIGEQGRVRRLNSDGTLETYIDGSFGTVKFEFDRVRDLDQAADGTLYVTTAQQLYRVGSDGKVTQLAGPGAVGPGPDASTSAENLALTATAITQDGTVYAAYGPGVTAYTPAKRVMVVGKDGTLKTVDPGIDFTTSSIQGMAAAPDGGLVFVTLPDVGVSSAGQVYHWLPGAKATLLIKNLALGEPTIPVVAPDGTVYVVDLLSQSLQAIAPDGTERVIAGAGAPPPADTYATVAGPVLGSDGTLYLADAASSFVRALGKDGTWRTIAGFDGPVQSGDGSSLAVNEPSGVAWDDQNRLIVVEQGSKQIKRYDGSTYTTIAGTTAGLAGDGGPATAAKFKLPTGLAFRAGTIYVGDSGVGTVRAIDASGTITTVAGNSAALAAAALQPGVVTEPLAAPLGQIINVAAASDGTLYCSNTNKHQVMRVSADHKSLTLLAGSPDALSTLAALASNGSAAPALGLGLPAGLACDAAGDLYVSDVLNCVLYKISGAAGASPTVSVVAGIGFTADLARGAAGAQVPEGALATDAALYLPASVCVAPDGTVYFAETGTTNIARASIPGVDSSSVALQLGLPSVPPRVRKISPDGHLTTVAGPGGTFLSDPNAENALVLPSGLALSADGRLAIVDAGSNLVHILPAGSF